MANELNIKPTYQTGLAKVNNTYLPMIAEQLSGNGINMNDYQKQCVMNAIAEINNTLDLKGISIRDVDQQTLTQILLKVAALQLNATATPREVYFITRKKKVGNDYISILEMGVEGDGNDSMMARFGRDVKQVHKFWEIREEDSFVYPKMKGLELTPPEWEPTGKGKVVRVVYPVEKVDGSIEYLISEREDVVRNLLGHINNNLMNETFGIAKSRYAASDSQKEEIDAKKKEIKDSMIGKSLDELLETDALDKYISPAWKEAQSSESMIIRKMRNNVTKKYPKDFSNSFVAMTYEETTDENVKAMRRDVTESANSIPFEDVSEPEIIDPEQSEEPVQEQSENDTDPF